MTPLLRRWGILCILAGISLLTFYNLDSLPSVYGRPGTPSRVAQITGKLQPGFQWKEVPEQYPVKSPMPLPAGAPKDLPRIQFKFKKETPSQKVTRERRKDEVKEVFVRSWNAYKKHAWLHDEVMPISGGSKDTFGGWGASLVDALDMLAIVGMEDEIRNATAELNKIDFNSSGQRDLNIFETTIRYLGGFLAAYDLTDGNYPILLDKAIDLGEMLYKAFDTPNRMPITRWDWLKYAISSFLMFESSANGSLPAPAKVVNSRRPILALLPKSLPSVSSSHVSLSSAAIQSTMMQSSALVM